MFTVKKYFANKKCYTNTSQKTCHFTYNFQLLYGISYFVPESIVLTKKKIDYSRISKTGKAGVLFIKESDREIKIKNSCEFISNTTG